MKNPKRKVKVAKCRRKRTVVVKPVEVVKVTLPPDKALCIEAPRDHVPVVAVHPTRSVVEVGVIPKKKKKKTFLEWLIGE